MCYILFTGDLSEVVHQHHQQREQQQHQQQQQQQHEQLHRQYQQQQQNHIEYNLQCYDCGGICCFADDSTYSVSSNNQDYLSIKLTEKYNLISNYMTSNELKLNNNKTHLMLMMTSNKRRNKTIDVSITTPTKSIKPTSCETLLGSVIHEGIKRANYIIHGNPDGQRSLNIQLNSRLNGIRLTVNLLP